MSEQTLAALNKELGGQGGELLKPLTETELNTLLQSVRVAKRKQKDALKAAIDEGMSFVPALLRIPLRRILFP